MDGSEGRNLCTWYTPKRVHKRSWRASCGTSCKKNVKKARAIEMMAMGEAVGGVRQ